MTEAAQIKRLGATPVKNSGRGRGKGDCILDGIVTIDIKEYARSWAVSIDNCAKIDTDAYRNGTPHSAVNVILGGQVNKMVISTDWFIEMYEAWKENVWDKR